MYMYILMWKRALLYIHMYMYKNVIKFCKILRVQYTLHLLVYSDYNNDYFDFPWKYTYIHTTVL